MNMPLVLLNRRRRGFTAFSPSTLFALAEPGVWFDPSDLTTLFQDPAGTTPVTTPGQTVARMNDKSGNGNHATQATIAARPTYSIEPVGGRRNLLEQTEDLSNAYWTAVGATSRAVSGSFTTFTENTSSGVHSLSRPSVITPTAYTNFTLSASFRAGTRRYIQFQFDNGTQGVGVVVDTQAWSVTPLTGAGTVTSSSIVQEDASTYRVTVSGIYTSGTFVANAAVYGLSSATQNSVNYTGNSSTFIVGKLQLELGSTATAYQRVTTQHDVTEAGVASVGYLYFDGVSNNMVTSTITPGTDKVQVFAGVRKLSDAATGVIAELSSNAAANTGAFIASAPNGAAPTYGLYSRGSASVASAATASGFAAPVSSVYTGIADISGDLTRIRVNGTITATDTADQGTGNYGNYPLYLGARGGINFPFSGHLYSLITRFGPTLDAPTIASTEIWVGDKTGIDIAKITSTTIYTRSGDTILDRANSTIERRAV